MFYNYKNSAIWNQFLRVVAWSTFLKKKFLLTMEQAATISPILHDFSVNQSTVYTLTASTSSDAQNARRHATTTGENWVGRKKPANEFFGAVLAALWLESSHLPNFTVLCTYLLLTYKNKEIWLVVIFTSSTVFPLD